jgi:Asp-tRNA(Asn)/Glu-tRNA(Gln) amidotransferase A subunit family amidase
VRIAEARRRIEESADLNAFICLTKETEGDPVIAVKDLIDVRGVPTTGGGAFLPDCPAAHDARVVAGARAAGCAVVGKTNLYEWAYGVSSVNPHYGNVRNPRDPTRSAGGSSSGSAAAVAAGICDWAIGSDTAGSIRIPASLCGVVGFKPTFGTLSTQGVIPLAPSLDTVGTLAPDVRTAAWGVGAMSSRGSLARSGPARTGRRLAVPAGWVAGLDEATARAWATVSAGLQEIGFPSRDELFHVAQTIQRAEATAFHRPWIERWPERYGSEVLEKLTAGLDVRAVDYLDARREQRRMRIAARRAMRDVDAILTPATACVAPPVDAGEVREPLTRFTRPFSLTGQPVVVLPAPVSGLPVGIQIVGRRGEDAALVDIAIALEEEWNGGP